MRTVLSLLCMLFLHALNAQSSALQFIENDHQVMMNIRSNPRLIGKIGDHLLMMDQIPQGTNLTVYDSSFHIIKQQKQLLSFYGAHKLILQDSLHVAWSEYHSEEEWLCLQTFDKEANASPVIKNVIDNKEHRFMNLVTDKLNQFYFFYTVTVRDSPNVLLKGVILDAHWNTLKEVSGIFQLSTSLERAPVPIIDAEGNIQVIVYDKLSNFKLSAGLTLHTLLFREDFFRKESFEFDKIKLYDPSIFEDVEKKQLILCDFFYDGQTREKMGLVTIKIPYERGTGLIPFFQEIPDSIKISFRANTSNLRTKQSVLESILKTDTYEHKGTKLVMSDLLDLPIHQLVRDAEVEPEYRSQNRVRYRNDRPIYFGGNSNSIFNVNSGLGISSNQDPNRAPARIPTIGSTGTRTPNTTNRGTNSTNAPSINPLPPLPANIEYKIFVPPIEKRAVFLLDDKGVIKWYQYLPETYVNYRFSLYSPVNFMMRTNQEWQFLHYDESNIPDAVNKTEPTNYNAIRFSLIGISEKGIRTQAIQSTCSVGTRFFKPMMLKENFFVMPFINNALGTSGLALLDMEKK